MGTYNFSVQVSDGGGKLLSAPLPFCNLLHAPYGYACQMHLKESLFHLALPAVIPFNDSGLKRNAPGLRRLGDPISESSEVAAVLPVPVSPILRLVLIPGHLRQVLRFGLRQLVRVSSTLPRTCSSSCPSMSSSFICKIFSNFVWIEGAFNLPI